MRAADILLPLQLRLRYPEEEIRSLPAKDKSTSTLAPSPPSQSNPASPQPQSTRAYLASWIPGNASPLRTATEGNSASAELAQQTEDDLASVATLSAPLTREKNRLTLRSFLRSFLLNSTLASSPVLRSFLLSGPQTLSPSEQADARRREDADRVRDEGRKRFKLEAGKRVEELRESVKELREEVIQSKGVRRVFEILKEVELVEDLPEEYRKVLEYGKISYVPSPLPPPASGGFADDRILVYVDADSQQRFSRRLLPRTTPHRPSRSSSGSTVLCRTSCSRES